VGGNNRELQLIPGYCQPRIVFAIDNVIGGDVGFFNIGIIEYPAENIK
jgi:hypothetical protein